MQYTLRPQVSYSSGSVVSTMFCKAKSAKKNFFFFARQFQTTSKQKISNLKPLLSITFPQGFRITRNIRHPTLGSGGKKTVKRYLKSEQNYPNQANKFLCYSVKKSRIRETKNFSIDADSRTDTILERLGFFLCLSILDHFQTKNFKSETTSFHYFSPRIANL